MAHGSLKVALTVVVNGRAGIFAIRPGPPVDTLSGAAWAAGLALSAGLGWRSSGVVGMGLSVAGIVALGVAWRFRR